MYFHQFSVSTSGGWEVQDQGNNSRLGVWRDSSWFKDGWLSSHCFHTWKKRHFVLSLPFPDPVRQPQSNLGNDNLPFSPLHLPHLIKTCRMQGVNQARNKTARLTTSQHPQLSPQAQRQIVYCGLMGLVVPKAEAGMKSVSSRCLPVSRESGSKHKVPASMVTNNVCSENSLFFLPVIPGAQEVVEKPLNPASLLSQGGGKNNVHV